MEMYINGPKKYQKFGDCVSRIRAEDIPDRSKLSWNSEEQKSYRNNGNTLL